MEVVYRKGRITAVELEQEFGGRVQNATVRKQLRILEERGHLTHTLEDGRFVYEPAHSQHNAAKGAMQNLLSTFFKASVDEAFSTLISAKDSKLSDEELARLDAILEKVR